MQHLARKIVILKPFAGLAYRIKRAKSTLINDSVMPVKMASHYRYAKLLKYIYGTVGL